MVPTLSFNGITTRDVMWGMVLVLEGLDYTVAAAAFLGVTEHTTEQCHVPVLRNYMLTSSFVVVYKFSNQERIT